MESAENILTFWFIKHGEEDWFAGTDVFDAELKARFADTHAMVGHGEAMTWREKPQGRLAVIIVLDQFSRQLYRNTPLAFAWDGMALVLAQEAIAGGHDEAIADRERMFFYMPFMHAESELMQHLGVQLFEQLGNEQLAGYAKEHLAVISKFGRFPFRNVALGRVSTAEELAHMEEFSARRF